jgi:lipoprotein signal peptidase
MRKHPAEQTTGLLVIGLALLLIGAVSNERMSDRAMFGLSGDFVSGFLMGLAIACMALALGNILRRR